MAMKYRYNIKGLKTGNSVRFPKASATVIAADSAVALTSGLVTVATDGNPILGIAQAAAGTGETEVDVIIPVDGDIFECDVEGTVLTKVTQANVGTVFDIGSTPAVVDLDDT